jgi:site-specific DNA-methyltransferase (adenine-specific)
MSFIKLYKGDCLEQMKQIGDNSIDAIITDPPYGTTILKWDSVIDFELMWEQLNRVIKPNGAIVLFAKQPFTSILTMSNIDNYKYNFVWHKSIAGNFINARKMPLILTEDILVFCNGVLKYNTKTEKKDKKNIRNTISDNKGIYKKGSHYEGTNKGKYNEFRAIPTDEKYTSNVLEYKSLGNNNKNRFHPTQKPIELMKRLIKHYTNENETVLDFTMGSGSTGVACRNNNRSFVGIEMDETYFNIAEQRIKEAQRQILFS